MPFRIRVSKNLGFFEKSCKQVFKKPEVLPKNPENLRFN